MLHQGAISVEQAEELLDALQRSYQSEASAAKPAELAAGAPAGLNPFANPAEFGASIAQRVMQGLSGAFGALRGVGGAAVGGRANFSHTRLTNESLSRMADGTSYSNFGHLEIAEDVSAELLSQKIGAFTNFGAVTGPPDLVGIVEGRCDANFGAFGEDEDEGEKEADWEGPEQSNLGKTVLTRCPAAAVTPFSRALLARWRRMKLLGAYSTKGFGAWPEYVAQAMETIEAAMGEEEGNKAMME
jgi:hypothetical protein